MSNETRRVDSVSFRGVVRAARLNAEGKVCYACGRKLPKQKPATERKKK